MKKHTFRLFDLTSLKARNMKYASIAASLVIVFGSTRYASAQGTTIYVKSGSSLQLDGTSTLHNFTCTTQDVEGSVIVDGSQLSGGVSDAKNFIVGANIVIPVKNLKSESDGLNDNMDNALKMKDNPNITYTFGNSESALAESGNSSKFDIKTMGTLTIGGAQKQIEMIVTLSKTDDGKITMHGREDVNMTDFGIDPPSFMFGALKAGNKVVISFDLMLAQ